MAPVYTLPNIFDCAFFSKIVDFRTGLIYDLGLALNFRNTRVKLKTARSTWELADSKDGYEKDT